MSKRTELGDDLHADSLDADAGAPEMLTYDVVIANYVTPRSLRIVCECLESVRRSSDNYRLILVDNASPAFDGIAEELALHNDAFLGREVKLIRNSENVGFVRATNQGLRLATADRVVLLNNDTVVFPGWLEKLDAQLKGKVGLAGPRSNHNGTVSGNLPYYTATILPRPSMLVFFCVMLTREVITQVGLLDEGFGVGLGDDDDYCQRAQQAGFDLCYVGDLSVYHYHKTTFNQLYTPEQLGRMGKAANARLLAKGTHR